MMNSQSPTFRDVEILSAYLDKQLPAADVSRLEKKLENDTALQGILADLRYSRSILRVLPLRKTPRNFTLTPKMAGVLPPVPRSYPYFRFASTFAAILFFFAFTVNLAVPALSFMKTSLPAPFADGMGGGGGAMPLAVEAPAAPAQDMVPEVTATPELSMLKTAPTEPAAVEAAPFAEVPDLSAQSAPQSRTMDPGTQNITSETLIPFILPVPAGILYTLIGLMTISASAAFILQVRSQNKWYSANSVKPLKVSNRQIILGSLFILAAVILAGVVYIVSAKPIYLPSANLNNPAFAGPSQMDLQSQAAVSALNGEKGPASGGDKGGFPASDTQGFTLSPEIGYNFTVMDASNQLTAIDFPPSFVKTNLLVTYIPGLNNISTDIPFQVNRAFTLVPEDKNIEFGAPLTFTFEYSADWASTVDKNKIVLFWWNGSGWQDAGTTCDPALEYDRHPETNRVVVSACRMGAFILAVP